MAAIPGNGGYVKVGTAGAAVRVDVGDWSLSDNNRLVDGTTSAYSSSNYEGTIGDHSVDLTLLADDTNFPETAGLVSGSKISISLHLGTLAKWHTISGATVATIGTVDKSDGDVIRMQVSCKGGTLAKYAAAAL